MNILGTIIRSDEIVGISQLYEQRHGEDMHLMFRIITKSTAVEIQSDIIDGFIHATKSEQQMLQSFRISYERIKYEVALMLGDAATIVYDHERTTRLQEDFQKLRNSCDLLATTLKIVKSKQKDAMEQMLGDIYANAKSIMEANL